MDQIKECFWCDELIQNDEKFVTLKFIGKTSLFKIYFHLIHYSAFAFWIGGKTQFDKAQFDENYKFLILFHDKVLLCPTKFTIINNQIKT